MKLEWRKYLFSDPVAWKTEFFAFASLGQMDHNFHRSCPQQAGKKTRTEIISNLQNLIHKTMESHMAKYESMMGSLRSFSDILANNRNELAPALNEEDLSDLEE